MSLYTEALEQLHGMTPELVTKPGEARRKFSLDELRVLLRAMGNPERRFHAVLVAGTNGKGSTAATLESILRTAGLRTGLFTSPHLSRPNERIRIAGEEIADEEFGRIFFRVFDLAKRMADQGRLPRLPSFFELLTAMAFAAFSEKRVQWAVLEVGMGGRLDATNVAEPELSIIADIALDHTEWLGSTLEAIAGEKAGILRPGGTLIRLPQCAEVDEVLLGRAAELRSHVVDASRYLASGNEPVEAMGSTARLESPLVGDHQRRNVALAVAAAVEIFSTLRVQGSTEMIEAGVRTTSWPGRLERIAAGGVDWVVDVAHNPAGVSALGKALDGLFANELEKRPQVLVFGCLRDKAVDEMAAELFPRFEQVILAPVASPRAASLDQLEESARAAGVLAERSTSVEDAVQRAVRSCGGRPVVVCGSVYLVGEARPLLMGGGWKG